MTRSRPAADPPREAGAAIAAPWPARERAEASPTDSRDDGRLPLLDAMRGLSALAVTCLHVGVVTPLRGPLAHALPRPLMWVFEHGHLAVAVFFALSGFVIARSLESADATPGFFGRFAVRRTLRLGPPYWAALALAVALHAIAAGLGRDTDMPSAGSVIAHVLYLQNHLGIPNIVAQFWTLPYEMQFYLVFCGLLVAERALVRRGARRSTVILALHDALAAASLAWYSTGADARGWFVREWMSFALGVLAWWALSGRASAAWWLLLAALVVLLAIPQRGEFMLTAVAASGLMLAAGKTGALARWGRSRPLRALSDLSYSLYLTHFVAWSAVHVLGPRFVRSPAAAVAFFVAALAGSLVLAEIFRRVVEAPSLRLARIPDPLASLRLRLRRSP